MRTFPTHLRRLHSLLIGLLLAAVLLKPLLAFDCFCTDPGGGDAVAAVVAGGDDCCPSQDCHDGCAHVTALVAPERLLALPHAGAAASIASFPPYRPRPPLGVFRPPIAN